MSFQRSAWSCHRRSRSLSGFIRMEKGCESCDFYQSIEDENRLFLLEEWDTGRTLCPPEVGTF
ncbi:putative quinol monooxygenase [Candidatus Kuenenia stuttgartensis]|uniref:putative quinol monooxygenase n=1 Tax=Kuenenia stuttgartiensis TaxID=174633 RepID=UPI003B967F4D